MSEELQSGEAVSETQAASAEDQNTTGAELATASEGEHEQNTPVVEEDAVAKAKAASQEAINKQHRKFREQERRSNDLQSKLDAVEKKSREEEAAKVGDIPSLPDEFDDDFKEKIAAREEAIIRKTQYDAAQANWQQQQQFAQQQEEQQAAVQLQQTVASYNTRATELGIDATELGSANNAVISYGLPDALVTHIVSDKDGPLLMKHLAANPADAITLGSLSPHAQGSFLVEMRTKAEALKPKQSNTPAPVDNLSGNGAQADLNKFPNSRGATFT